MRCECEQSEDAVSGVPVSALLHEARRNKYGSVPGLDDEELADPEELERQIVLDEWGPILALPVRHESHGVRPAIDEEGHVDWGAFGTVDFSRVRPEFDNTAYRAGKLREELRDVLIMLSIVKERLSGRAKYLVLRYLRMGLIDETHIVHEDMRALARLDARARRMQEQIAELGDLGEAQWRQEMAWLLT